MGKKEPLKTIRKQQKKAILFKAPKSLHHKRITNSNKIIIKNSNKNILMTTKTTLSRFKKHTQNHDSNQVKSQQPIIPMNKVSLDVIRKLQTQPYPQLNLATHSTISDALDLYFNEYVRLFKQNQILNDQLASILLERNSLADQFNQIKKMKSYDDNIRRRRRYASEIQRNYHCPMPKCNKGYGSEGSLTHHVRLKHPHFFETGEYQIYLETYILPKQQIKNEDKDAKAINVEEFDGETTMGKKINHSNTKSKKFDEDKVKEAKEEDNNGNVAGAKKASTQNGQKSSKKQKAPQTPLMQSLMRQVDGYIELDGNGNQKERSSKIDENREQTKVQEKQHQDKKISQGKQVQHDDKGKKISSEVQRQ